jgi:hypothetical protein
MKWIAVFAVWYSHKISFEVLICQCKEPCLYARRTEVPPPRIIVYSEHYNNTRLAVAISAQIDFWSVPMVSFRERESARRAVIFYCQSKTFSQRIHHLKSIHL